MSSTIGQSERITQNRVIQLFQDELRYDYLGNWHDRPHNSNIEESLLTKYLSSSGYTDSQISKALYELRTAATNPNRSLYDNNQAVYSLLRYGIQIKTAAGELTATIKPINWQQPEQNHWSIAEEVTIKGTKEKRPDIIIYLNGIAIGIIELKNSRTSIADGIRQSLTNQQPEFIGSFFSPSVSTHTRSTICGLARSIHAQVAILSSGTQSTAVGGASR